ncbi:hypothetical protein EVAR_89961_1 [Eumeta japonica]|uniref:Uncharacterized protein n=1 Tax=Eumeta variegata TaxID=151549 RepID=A0A4C2ACL5_EUMVA|nr:hypothetical protein EVAR_89961_1 [Eumeta japonica]
MEYDLGSILLVSELEVMINRDNWGIRIATLEVKFLDRRKTNINKAFAKVFSSIKNEKLEVRRRYRPSSNRKYVVRSADVNTTARRAASETKDFGLRGVWLQS